jgi:hypothetical protein
MAQCTIDRCDAEGLHKGKCSLHCSKSDYQKDSLDGVLSAFFEELIKYLYDEFIAIPSSDFHSILESQKIIYSDKDGASLLTFLLINKNSNVFDDFFIEQSVAFDKISFPERKDRDYFDYFKLFVKFKSIHFDYCNIHFTSLDINELELFFQDCEFKNHWSINSYAMLDNSDNVIFGNCKFLSTIDGYVSKSPIKELKIKCQLFRDCEFSKDINFHGVTFEKTIFNNSEQFIQNLNRLSINKCTFNDRFLLNNGVYNEFKIKNSAFKGKFEIKNNSITSADIDNVNFLALFDAYNTKFAALNVKKSIFEDFTGFERCEFGIENDETRSKVEFEYVTFLNFTNFRKAKFFNGLDFEHTNLKEPPNFLNAEINERLTNRETFRIIKDSFDKIGNKIEANRYHSYEMRKYKDELKLLKTITPERVIFSFNELVSNFGASIGRPLFLMLLSAFTYYLLVLGYEGNILYSTDVEVFNKALQNISSVLNTVAKGIPPYGRFLKSGMEFVTLIFHILFLTFTWHFIIAVKRCTKR